MKPFSERVKEIVEEKNPRKLKVKRGWATVTMLLLMIPIALCFVLNKTTGALNWGTTYAHAVAKASNNHLVEVRKEQKSLKDKINEQLDLLKDQKTVEAKSQTAEEKMDDLRPEAETSTEEASAETGRVPAGTTLKVDPIGGTA